MTSRSKGSPYRSPSTRPSTDSETFPVDGSTHYGFSASATVSRTAFNMNTLIPVLSDKVKLELEAQFVHPAG